MSWWGGWVNNGGLLCAGVVAGGWVNTGGLLCWDGWGGWANTGGLLCAGVVGWVGCHITCTLMAVSCMRGWRLLCRCGARMDARLEGLTLLLLLRVAGALCLQSLAPGRRSLSSGWTTCALCLGRLDRVYYVM